MEKKYINGIIGGFIGGLIATIPWILMYVYGNMILSLLAIIIAMGVLKGYQIAKGKIDNKLPIIVTTLSILSVTLATFIIIPIFLMIKEDININMDNFLYIYDNSSFVSAIIRDYVVSLLFTFLGISGVIANIKKQINQGVTEDIKINLNEGINQNTLDDIGNIKDVFVKLNALDKNTAVEKNIILDNLNEDEKKKFNTLKMQQIIIKYRGKYYFSEKNEKSFGRRFLKLYLKIMLWIIIFFIVLFLIIMLLGS